MLRKHTRITHKLIPLFIYDALVKQEGQNKVKASLLDGLRHVLAGGLRLRVKNVDFERKTKVKPATVKQKSSSDATYA